MPVVDRGLYQGVENAAAAQKVPPLKLLLRGEGGDGAILFLKCHHLADACKDSFGEGVTVFQIVQTPERTEDALPPEQKLPAAAGTAFLNEGIKESVEVAFLQMCIAEIFEGSSEGSQKSDLPGCFYNQFFLLPIFPQCLVFQG